MMYTWEIENLVFSKGGNITIEDFNKIYDSPQMTACLFDYAEERYPYEFWLSDKPDPIFFNVQK